jgi:TetR/AcrR family transcriptional repressor of nem operon
VASTGPAAESRHESKVKLLDAALEVIRAKGYAATRVEDICEAAGLTKGSFFHHFKSKEDLAIAAAQHWSAVTGGLFVTAPYHDHADPVDRLLAYLDFRKALLRGAMPEFTCLAGTMVQEVYATHPAIRDSCGASIAGHAATLVPDIDAARRQYGVAGDWSAESLALHTQAVLQGAFILAKAKQDPTVAADCIDHLRRYLEFLFRQPEPRRNDHDQCGTDDPNDARQG